MFARRFSWPALALALLAPLGARSQVSLSIHLGPPALPVYVQPVNPGQGYLWTPGYWRWSAEDADYYWVPGTWVLPPTVGLLWTPGYWAYVDNGYQWRIGYWADRVGFYGGLNYGHGYFGTGYQGGRWDRGVFRYNITVNNIDRRVIRNVYRTTIVRPVAVTRVSFNGGPGGVRREPNAAERVVQLERHVDATPNQVEHEKAALKMPIQRATINHGTPQIAATRQPSAFDGKDVVRARETPAAARQRAEPAADRPNGAKAPAATRPMPAASAGRPVERVERPTDRVDKPAPAAQPHKADAPGPAMQPHKADAPTPAMPARKPEAPTPAAQSHRPEAPAAQPQRPESPGAQPARDTPRQPEPKDRNGAPNDNKGKNRPNDER